MSEGIKALPDNDQDNQDANLGLSGGISGGDDKGDLFLSAREQRGLEAAAFGSVLGQAPATGNIFGDLLSVAAQTAPASLATFKERQSIKEKEAEYQSKKASLAGKLKGTTYYEIRDGDLFPVVMTDEEYLLASRVNPNRYIPYFDPGKNPGIFYDNRENSDTRGDNVPFSASKAAILNDIARKQGRNIPFLPKDEIITVYDFNKPLLKQKTQIKQSEYNRTFGNRDDNYMANVIVSDEEPARYKLEIDNFNDKNQRFREAQAALQPQLVAATGMLDYRRTIMDALSKGEGSTGSVKDLTLGVGNLVGFVKQGLDVFGTALYGSKNGSAIAEREVKSRYAEGGGDDAMQEYLENKKADVGLNNREQLMLDLYSGKLKTTDKLYADAQKIKTAVTQLVYMVAKTRESGGKFSVPDIQFAFDSIGDGSNIVSLKTGIDTIMGETISSLMIKAEASYFQYGQERMTKADLYNNPEFIPFRSIVEYDAERRLTSGRMSDAERKEYLEVFPQGSKIYEIFENYNKKEVEEDDGSLPNLKKKKKLPGKV